MLWVVAMVAFSLAEQGLFHVEPSVGVIADAATTESERLDLLTSFDASSPSATAARRVNTPSPARMVRRTTIGSQTTPRLDNQTVLQSGRIQNCRTQLANYSFFGKLSFASVYLIPTFIIHRRLLI